MNLTNSLPDFTKYGYQAIKQLGNNQETSCITWQGIIIEKNIPVVIKQFRFATKYSSWLGYQTCQQEIELLKNLNHPRIPQFIAIFETDDSFCFVKEYIAGNSLSKLTTISEKLCKIIAVKVLNILIYLQQQQPPVFCLGITPDTVIVDKHNNVYLIDFSLAQIADTNSTLLPSLINAGNAEFIAPEQIKNPVFASDVYSLGAALKNLINQQQFLDLASKQELDAGFLEWLDRSTEKDLAHRYPDAETALQELKTSCWDDIDTIIKEATTNVSYTNFSQKTFAVGVATMAVLSFAIAFGFNLVYRVTEKSLINVVTALIGVVIIYVTQSASTTIVVDNNTEKKQSAIVAILIPTIMTITAGVILGKGEAVAMSLAAIVAQAINLSCVLFKKLQLNQPYSTFRIGILLTAILFSFVLGTKLFTA